jgi:sterol desaturase/sphingolipid hydroxylase (fatty acid hydroxylase superfamily)
MTWLEQLVPVFIIAFFAVGMVLERAFAARPLPRVAGWNLRAGIGFVVTLAVNAVVPMLVATVVAGKTLLDLRGLGTLAGGGVAFLLSDLLAYWLHRTQHRLPWLWRITHQMHHSAERVDVLGASFFHPLDIGMQAALSTLAVGFLGVTPDAAALAGLANVLLAVFQHLNVRTPSWIGWLAQRPEGHSLHHARDVHAYNYGNLSIWDLAFGTFRNPAEFEQTAGFYDGASARVGAMLAGRDVSTP